MRLAHPVVRFALMMFVAGQFAGSAAARSLIQQENAKEGATDWVLTNPAKNREIEGYASLTSVNRGDALSLYVNTSAPLYEIDLFRLGWYGGKGARRMAAAIRRPGVSQPRPFVDASTHLVECRWIKPYVLSIPKTPPTEWISGMYLVKLTTVPSGRQAYISFVVREDARRSALLFQSSVATYQAYNTWGGWSLYTNPRAFKVSFDRPFLGLGAPPVFEGAWEYSMLRFLEREGYDVTYCTDLDTHEQGKSLLLHKAFIVVGHDEYWSWEMRNNVEAARDHGVNLGFFSADDAYWQVRFEKSVSSGAPDRVMVCYKDKNLDPQFHSGKPYLTTVAFRNSLINRPEAQLIGVMADHGHGEDTDIVIQEPSSWIFANTRLKKGDRLKGLLGYENDRIYDSSPYGVQDLAHSPFKVNGKVIYSDMTVYTAASGSLVVATGSMQWCWGLDAYPRRNRLSRAAQQATRNILHKFGA